MKNVLIGAVVCVSVIGLFIYALIQSGKELEANRAKIKQPIVQSFPAIVLKKSSEIRTTQERTINLLSNDPIQLKPNVHEVKVMLIQICDSLNPSIYYPSDLEYLQYEINDTIPAKIRVYGSK